MTPGLTPPRRFLTALLTARPDKLEELSNTLLFLTRGLSGHPGCLNSMAGRDLGGEARFFLHSQWADAASLEAYLDSDDYRVLRGASSILAAPGGFQLTVALPPESPPDPVGGAPLPSLPPPPFRPLEKD